MEIKDGTQAMDSLNELNDDDHVTQRALEWSSSLGVSDGLYIRAHRDPIEYKHCEGGRLEISHDSLNDLSSRLDLERKTLSPSATFSDGEHAHTDTMFHGMSSAPLSGIDFRTRFEHDRDSILHCEPFRRLAGKTQVHLERSDHQRTRLTHALEVAQIASAIARSLRLNAVLAEAIALGHDCGHGPGGHASEDALDPYLDGGFHHAIFGAEVTLRPLRLSHEVIDGVRNHSWSLDTPLTPEAEVVSFSDRIAYVCHDLEDALSCSMVSRRDYPQEIASFLNLSRGEQIGRFIRGVVQGTFESGTVAILHEYGEILSAMRKFNTEFIYRSPRSMKQNALVIEMLSELVEFFIGHSQVMPQYFQRNDEGDARVREGVVEYVAGMTDDYAYRMHAQYVKNDPITSHEVLYMI